jgi:phosphatidylinositol glycan class B
VTLLGLLRINSGLADDRDWRKFVVRWSLVSLLLIATACYFSIGHYAFDEHYSILEFVGRKLGKTPDSAMVWEYHAQIRPWLQPAIYYVAARGLMALGIENPFTLAMAFRAISGLCGWAAIVSLMLSARVLFADELRRRACVIILAVLWLIPYLAVRTSSESLSGSFFSLGIAVLLLGSRRESEATTFRPIVPLSTAILCGICFGLSFEFRYQIGFAIVGVLGWLLCFSAESWRATVAKMGVVIAAIALPVALGTLVDRWGYGHWVCVPWNYFQVLIVQGVHDHFGVSGPWWYFIGVNSQPALPITLLWTAGLVTMWIRYPHHLLSWTTGLFIAVHSAIGHKEVRFLFPIVLVSTFAFVIAYCPGEIPQTAWRKFLWQSRRSWVALWIYTLNFALLGINCLASKQPDLVAQQAIYNAHRPGEPLYLVGADAESPYVSINNPMYFFRPADMPIVQVAGYDALPSSRNGASDRLLVMSNQLSDPAQLKSLKPKPQLLYRTYPAWVEQYNYFHWLSRSRHYRLDGVTLEEPILAAKRTESLPATK